MSDISRWQSHSEEEAQNCPSQHKTPKPMVVHSAWREAELQQLQQEWEPVATTARKLQPTLYYPNATTHAWASPNNCWFNHPQSNPDVTTPEQPQNNAYETTPSPTTTANTMKCNSNLLTVDNDGESNINLWWIKHQSFTYHCATKCTSYHHIFFRQSVNSTSSVDGVSSHSTAVLFTTMLVVYFLKWMNSQPHVKLVGLIPYALLNLGSVVILQMTESPYQNIPLSDLIEIAMVGASLCFLKITCLLRL